MAHTFDDPILIDIAASVPLPDIESTGDLFHDLASCILEQQIHYRSTKGVFARMLERAGIERLRIDNVDEFEERGLDDSALSARKTESFVALVDFFRSDETDWPSLSDIAVRKKLSTIHGVGPWTVDMILLYTLGRPDVFPAIDMHLKNAMADRYDIASGSGMNGRMIKIANDWRPHRSLAVRYLLAWEARKREQAE